MSNTTTADRTTPARTSWASWLAIAVVAIGMGLLSPQLIPGETVQNPERKSGSSEKGTAEKGKLEYSAPVLPEAPSMQGMLTRLGVGTVLVLGLCVATMWGIRRYLYPVAANGSLPREMRLMETLQLGNRCCVHLVHLGKQPILVGADAMGVKTIVPLSPAFEEILTDAEAPPVVSMPTPSTVLGK